MSWHPVDGPPPRDNSPLEGAAKGAAGIIGALAMFIIGTALAAAPLVLLWLALG